MTRSPAGERGATLVSARKVAAAAAFEDDFAYSVLADVAVPRPGGERRTGARQRTRLRSGKLVGLDGRFLTECLIANRSPAGGLLRLPLGVALPQHLMLYDDGSGVLVAAQVIWRRDRAIGIRFTPSERSERHRAIAEAMRRKYYAMRT